MMLISASPADGDIENLLPCGRPGSGDTGRDGQYLSKGELGSETEISPIFSSPYTIMLSLRNIELLGLASRRADLHLFEMKSPSLRTLIHTSSPNWPF